MDPDKEAIIPIDSGKTGHVYQLPLYNGGELDMTAWDGVRDRLSSCNGEEVLNLVKYNAVGEGTKTMEAYSAEPRPLGEWEQSVGDLVRKLEWNISDLRDGDIKRRMLIPNCPMILTTLLGMRTKNYFDQIGSLFRGKLSVIGTNVRPYNKDYYASHFDVSERLSVSSSCFPNRFVVIFVTMNAGFSVNDNDLNAMERVVTTELVGECNDDNVGKRCVVDSVISLRPANPDAKPYTLDDGSMPAVIDLIESVYSRAKALVNDARLNSPSGIKGVIISTTGPQQLAFALGQYMKPQLLGDKIFLAEKVKNDYQMISV